MSLKPGELSKVRVESDLIGALDVPLDAYYGVHTVRSVQNFPITGTTIAIYPELIDALAAVKAAAARANAELGVLDGAKADVIVAACERIRAGELHDQFVVDPIQGGAGTSTNMNANEVIANLALEIMGFERGHYSELHPVEDVNQSQSTNDVYPTAVKVAVHWALDGLIDAMTLLRDAFYAKGEEFADILKVGRTQMQDAVPMTLGQEFAAYATTIDEDILRVAEARQLVREVNLGGTAIGTGLNAPVGYGLKAVAILAETTGVDVVLSKNIVEATSDVGAFVQLSGVLKRVAVKISKICSDLRLLSSGPRAGFGEITLPAMQAGSSIMPGKINPVIPEVVNQIAFEVVGNDVTISMAADGGQLQLNAFEPIIVSHLFDSINHLAAGMRVLADRCVVGIEAHREHLEAQVWASIGLATALNPVLGYEISTQIAKEALATGASIPDLVVAQGHLTKEEVAALLSPEKLIGSGSAGENR